MKHNDIVINGRYMDAISPTLDSLLSWQCWKNSARSNLVDSSKRSSDTEADLQLLHIIRKGARALQFKLNKITYRRTRIVYVSNYLYARIHTHTPLRADYIRYTYEPKFEWRSRLIRPAHCPWAWDPAKNLEGGGRRETCMLLYIAP